MSQQGFNELYTLEKGIQNYLKQNGGDGDGLWKGSLFVFDARMAVPPGAGMFLLPFQGHHAASPFAGKNMLSQAVCSLHACASIVCCNADAGEASEGAEGSLPAAAPCSLCGGAAQLPHVNCANIDCNALFLSCEACRVSRRNSGGHRMPLAML